MARTLYFKKVSLQSKRHYQQKKPIMVISKLELIHTFFGNSLSDLRLFYRQVELRHRREPGELHLHPEHKAANDVIGLQQEADS